MRNLEEEIQINSSQYVLIHIWLKKNYGKADKCENPDCEYKNPKRFEWVLIKGKKHKKIRTNYMMLCPSCHRKYDMTDLIREKLRQVNIGRIMSQETRNKISDNHKRTGLNKKIVEQYSIIDEFMRKWDSITEASNQFKILKSSISNCLNGRAKTAGNFIWKYQT